MKLKEKHVLITGASQGLGRAMAVEFARQGAKALVLVARQLDGLNETVRRIKQGSPDALVIPIGADLSCLEAIETIVATTFSALHGKLDVLVNNASYLGPSPMPLLVDYPLDEFQRVIATNLLAPFLLTKKALPAIIASGGSIINVTSDAGVTGYSGWGAYGISKFGLEGLSQTWSAELAQTGARVNWVDPGSMNTAMHRAAEPEEDPSQWSDPSLVLDVFIFLASDESIGVNGKRFRAQESGWGWETCQDTAVKSRPIRENCA